MQDKKFCNALYKKDISSCSDTFSKKNFNALLLCCVKTYNKMQESENDASELLSGQSGGNYQSIIPKKEISKGAKSFVSAKGWGVRHTFVLMLALGNAIAYSTRVNISVLIVAMADQSFQSGQLLCMYYLIINYLLFICRWQWNIKYWNRVSFPIFGE